MNNGSVTDFFINSIQDELALRRLRSQDSEFKKAMQAAPPYSANERKPERKNKRLAACKNDFWKFDKTYFPADLYQEYSTPGKYHKDIAALADLKDKKAHVIAGPRETAKTATFKKKIIHLLLYGHRRYIQIVSETLTTPVAFVLDLMDFLELNDRIQFDFKITFVEASEEKVFIRTDQNPKGTYLGVLSERRSSRSKARGLFLRPDLIYITDLENETSSFADDSIDKRIRRLNEMRTSLSRDGVVIWEGNNFHVDCAMNQLFKEDKAGILSDQIIMHKFKAWDPTRPPKQRSIWPQRFPANSEQELRALMKPLDGDDWAGNFQQEPRQKSGKIFPLDNYQEAYFPHDLKAVIYTDPNLSLKGKGDTTAITCIGFSIEKMAFFIPGARCKSYSSSNDLLDDLLDLYNVLQILGVTVLGIGFDGNVNQESTWTNNIINYMRLKNTLVPRIQFMRYNVDDLTKNVELDWKDSRFYFEPDFNKSEEGAEYMRQVNSFVGKKAKRKDDAPDSMICGYEFLHSYGAVKLLTNVGTISSISRRRLAERV